MSTVAEASEVCLSFVKTFCRSDTCAQFATWYLHLGRTCRGQLPDLAYGAGLAYGAKVAPKGIALVPTWPHLVSMVERLAWWFCLAVSLAVFQKLPNFSHASAGYSLDVETLVEKISP